MTATIHNIGGVWLTERKSTWNKCCVELHHIFHSLQTYMRGKRGNEDATHAYTKLGRNSIEAEKETQTFISITNNINNNWRLFVRNVDAEGRSARRWGWRRRRQQRRLRSKSLTNFSHFFYLFSYNIALPNSTPSLSIYLSTFSCRVCLQFLTGSI